MPTNISGSFGSTRRPGIYAQVDASALGGAALELGNIVVIGVFPAIKPLTAVRYTSPRTLADADTSDVTYARIAKIAFNPASDDRVAGSPTSIYLINADDTTNQARTILLDAAGAPCIALVSKVFGFTGNRTSVAVAAGTTSGKKITLIRDGVTEIYDDLDNDAILKVRYSNSDATTMTLTQTAGTGLTVDYTIVEDEKSDTYTNNDVASMAFDGKLTLVPSGTAGGGQSYVVTVTGTSTAGVPTAEDITFGAAELSPKTTVADFSAVTSILYTHSSGAASVVFTVSGTAFNLTNASYSTVQSIIDAISARSDKGYTASTDSVVAAATLAREIDNVSAVDIKGSQQSLQADLKAVLDALKNSGLVTAYRADTDADSNGVYDVTGVAKPYSGAQSGYGKAVPANITTLMSGGTADTAEGTADWTNAFLEARSVDAQIVVPMTSQSAAHSLAKSHCAYMAGKGQNERNAWVGTGAGANLTLVADAAKLLNSRHVTLVCQEIETFAPDNSVERLPPMWFALMSACIQASTFVATPLTRKRPNVIAAYTDSTIKPDLEAEDLLTKGICFLTKDRLGLRYERSITTYMTDDNPVWSETSANESVNTSIRDLRARLMILIGDAAKATTATKIKSLAITRLRGQVASGIIKAFNEGGVTVDDLGDTFRVNYEVAAVEPVNFILINTTVVRIATSA